MRKFYDDKSWSFLIASPSFSGPIFEETVILLLEDNEDGAFGIIINKTLGKTLGELNADFISSDLSEVEVFDGGPLVKDRISLALCTGNKGDDDAIDGAFAFGVTPEKARETLAKNPDSKLGAFAGYVGWESGQLQREIDEGIWIVCNADINMMFDVSPEEIWQQLLLQECPKFEKLPTPKTNPSLN